MALGYHTWLRISSSRRDTGRLLPFTLIITHSSHPEVLSPLAFVYNTYYFLEVVFLSVPRQRLSPSYWYLLHYLFDSPGRVSHHT